MSLGLLGYPVLVAVTLGSVCAWPLPPLNVTNDAPGCWLNSTDGILFCDYANVPHEIVILEPIEDNNITKVDLRNINKLHLSDSLCIEVELNNVTEVTLIDRDEDSCPQKGRLGAKGTFIDIIPTNITGLILEESEVSNLILNTMLSELVIARSTISDFMLTSPLLNISNAIVEDSVISSLHDLTVNNGTNLVIQRSKLNIADNQIVRNNGTITIRNISETAINGTLILSSSGILVVDNELGGIKVRCGTTFEFQISKVSISDVNEVYGMSVKNDIIIIRDSFATAINATVFLGVGGILKVDNELGGIKVRCGTTFEFQNSKSNSDVNKHTAINIRDSFATAINETLLQGVGEILRVDNEFGGITVHPEPCNTMMSSFEEKPVEIKSNNTYIILFSACFALLVVSLVTMAAWEFNGREAWLKRRSVETSSKTKEELAEEVKPLVPQTQLGSGNTRNVNSGVVIFHKNSNDIPSSKMTKNDQENELGDKGSVAKRESDIEKLERTLEIQEKDNETMTEMNIPAKSDSGNEGSTVLEQNIAQLENEGMKNGKPQNKVFEVEKLGTLRNAEPKTRNTDQMDSTDNNTKSITMTFTESGNKETGRKEVVTEKEDGYWENMTQEKNIMSSSLSPEMSKYQSEVEKSVLDDLSRVEIIPQCRTESMLNVSTGSKKDEPQQGEATSITKKHLPKENEPQSTNVIASTSSTHHIFAKAPAVRIVGITLKPGQEAGNFRETQASHNNAPRERYKKPLPQGAGRTVSAQAHKSEPNAPPPPSVDSNQSNLSNYNNEPTLSKEKKQINSQGRILRSSPKAARDKV